MNLYEFSTTAPDIPVLQENLHQPLVKLVYESTQPLKDTQKDVGRQLGLSDSDQDVAKFKSYKKIVLDSEDEELDIQTTPAKICSNDKCKNGLSIEWKSWENGLLCFGCWEYYSKYSTFINFKKEVKPIKTKNFKFLTSPRGEKRANFHSSPIQRRHDQPRFFSGRQRRQVSAKRNYKESSSSDQDVHGMDKKRLKKIKENSSSLDKKLLDKTTSMQNMLFKDEIPNLVKNALVWAYLNGNYYSAIVVSVGDDTVDVLFFQGPVGHELPIGNYKIKKSSVEFLDLDSDHNVYMDIKGQKVEYRVSEALSDGALLLIQPKDECLVVGTRHGIYMDEKLLKRNSQKSIIKINKGIYDQIFENIYIIFSLSLDGEKEIRDHNQEIEEIKKSFAFRGGEIFEIGDHIPENVKVLCISNLPNKSTVFLSCLAKKIPIISLGWLKLCVKHETLIDPLLYIISSGLSELIQETSFPVSRFIHQNLETNRVFEDKVFRLDGPEQFVEKWKFILECGGANIVSLNDAFSLSEESETWLEQCLVHQYYFGYFRKGDQFEADIFKVNNMIS